jgi:hypothetical protein
MLNFPGLDRKHLQLFREMYGASAFVCRYLHCALSTDGFDSSVQRERHESQHRRRFRCSHSSCTYFMIGFASKPLLNRHNDKWHPLVANGTSLADTIKALNDAPKETYNNAEPLPPLQQKVKVINENESSLEQKTKLQNLSEFQVKHSLRIGGLNPYLLEAPEAASRYPPNGMFKSVRAQPSRRPLMPDQVSRLSRIPSHHWSLLSKCHQNFRLFQTGGWIKLQAIQKSYVSMI